MADFAAESCDVHYWLDSLIGRVVSNGAALGKLASQFRAAAGRLVTDATKLAGRYAIDLRYSAALTRDGLPPADDAPDIHAALREQLGLKLESSTTTVEYLVVDRIERPT